MLGVSAGLVLSGFAIDYMLTVFGRLGERKKDELMKKP